MLPQAPGNPDEGADAEVGGAGNDELKRPLSPEEFTAVAKRLAAVKNAINNAKISRHGRPRHN